MKGAPTVGGMAGCPVAIVECSEEVCVEGKTEVWRGKGREI